MGKPAPPLQPYADFGKPADGLRRQLYTIIFEADTKAGLRFDVILIIAILTSVLVVILDSVQDIHLHNNTLMTALEWGFTLLFTLEYLTRLYCVDNRLRYATSFFGIIDLISVLPTYIAFFVPEAHALLDVRVLRLLRIFRVLKLTMYVAEYSLLVQALRASRRKIMIFITFVLMLDLLLGTMLYVVEGPEHGFTSIPMSVYWAIVTMTTVGYGDIVPHTDLGKMIASLTMLLGWGTLAVPTGIVTAEMTAHRMGRSITTRTCPACLTEGHDADAKFCKICGKDLPAYRHD